MGFTRYKTLPWSSGRGNLFLDGNAMGKTRTKEEGNREKKVSMEY